MVDRRPRDYKTLKPSVFKGGPGKVPTIALLLLLVATGLFCLSVLSGASGSGRKIGYLALGINWAAVLILIWWWRHVRRKVTSQLIEHRWLLCVKCEHPLRRESREVFCPECGLRSKTYIIRHSWIVALDRMTRGAFTLQHLGPEEPWSFPRRPPLRRSSEECHP